MKNIIDTAKEVGEDISETLKERLFSPVYFYFIIAWLITNWQFIFSLFALDQKYLRILKVDYLTGFYQFDSWINAIISLSKLLIVPAISTWVVVWYLSIWAEEFYKKTYQSKMNKEAIKRKIDYLDKMHLSREQRLLREVESYKKIENKAFNQYLDDTNPQNILVSSIEMKPSEVLYNTDYQAYVDLYDEFINSDEVSDENRDMVLEEHANEMKSQAQFDEMRDK
jgi:hypothetical protein